MSNLKKAEPTKIAVVIPAYKCADKIVDVLESIPTDVTEIVVVDDSCPDGTGNRAKNAKTGARLTVLTNERNMGVGGAMKKGFTYVLSETTAEVVVKMDADGQMDANQIIRLVNPLLEGAADFTKGNRFSNISDLRVMPPIRILGNAGLSIVSKLSHGYWQINDPTNGFFAISRECLQNIAHEKLSQDYFFENSLLYRLSLSAAVVKDIPIPANYGDEESNLSPWRSLISFPPRLIINGLKRVLLNYFVKTWSFGSIALVAGLFFIIFGGYWTIDQILESIQSGVQASAGQVMIGALPLIIGFQSLMMFFAEDVREQPSRATYSLIDRGNH